MTAAAKRQEAHRALGSAVNMSAALLEVLVELMLKPIEGDCLALDMNTVEGLHELAIKQGSDLRKRFEELAANDMKGVLK